MAVDAPEEKVLPTGNYNHQRWVFQRGVLRFLIRHIGFNLLLKVEKAEGMENVPKSGPAILMINHLSFADSILALEMCPRQIVPLAKIEVYEYPVVGIFPKLWGVIPVRREEVDRQAIRQALEVLNAGEMILVAPEGTRHTQLEQGKLGIAYLASRGNAAVVPVAISDTPGFPALRFNKRWQGPGAKIKYGKPFRFRSSLGRHSREQLRQMTDEAMYVLAAMLPEERRGYYADLSKATTETIEWP
jgi:1-acyl-sn-glycerol-3-phosphate acyltransferase